jgi:hypothetical protein
VEWAEVGRETSAQDPRSEEGRMTRLPKRVLYRIALAGSSVLALVWL